MKYRIAVCDDEPRESAYLSTLVQSWAGKSGNTAVISVFSSAEAFLFDYAEHKDYDILLLDIEMKAINGVELAKHVRAENTAVQIVFVTGYPDFIAEGYEVAALHYLIKPVSADKLSEVLDRAAAVLSKCERAVFFQIGGESVRVAADRIVYTEAFAHSVVIHTTDDSFEVRIPISDAERLLGEGFARCHRSYLVGVKYIARIAKTELTLDGGKTIPVSRSAFPAVYRIFIDTYTGGNA